ncbi:MAG: hypothetical protein E7F15_02650 [Clostridiales bacterium]|nr:hypothetical protein [Clostridiales bacterium]
MTINDDDLQIIIEQVLMDEREQIYLEWIDTEDIIIPSLTIKQPWHRKKPIAVMDLEDWEQYRANVKEVLQALYYAYMRLKLFEQDQRDTAISFDEYIKKEVLAYDSEEFEWVREHFETQCIDSSEADIEL